MRFCISANKDALWALYVHSLLCPHIRSRQPPNRSETNLERWFSRARVPQFHPDSSQIPLVLLLQAHRFDSCLCLSIFLPTNLILMGGNFVLFTGTIKEAKQ